MAAEGPRRWRRFVAPLVGCVVICVLATTWLASSRTSVSDLGAADELLVVNTAGPVRVRSIDSYDGPADNLDGGTMIIRTAESWLLGEPTIEEVSTGDTAAFRVICATRLPCRVAVEVFVPAGIDLSIVVDDDPVQIDAFRGAMSVFSGEGGVVLGEVDGSVRITSDGPVIGANLGPSALAVNVVDDDVTLSYLDAPTLLSIVGGTGEIVVEIPASDDYAVAVEAPNIELGIESDPASDRLVSVQSEGPVSLQPTPMDEDS